MRVPVLAVARAEQLGGLKAFGRRPYWPPFLYYRSVAVGHQTRRWRQGGRYSQFARNYEGLKHSKAREPTRVVAV